MFYNYALLSKKDGRFYVGFTKNLQRRLDDHQRGEVPSTVGRGPLELIYYEVCLSQNDAISREKYFKTGYGKRFLRNRMRTYIELEG